ncbi:hypothetical protein SISNIDRAFT_491685 [Sistotremastrum niveocremeum HHB9708]|uniref:G-protein coupled receptors family 1 profile domain-containing protein n=1 Tax=Sistotremastrum niveocremeum HHB9708 TaxID=1314777 RepID=A0A164MHT0_9AGAM|nr:hypothetical protein SISNIDRAFT_491685 [Sistotremastrum niveocremeum HHB9708]
MNATYPPVRWGVDSCTRNMQIRTGVTASLWSVLLVLFLLNIHNLLTRFGIQPKVRIILGILATTFFVATLEFALNVQLINFQTPILIYHPADMKCYPADPLYLQIPMVIQMLIGDAFTVFRTWLLWDRKLIAVLFPVILLLFIGQWIILMFVRAVGVNASYIAVIPVSLTLNVVCLALIAYRLYKHPKLSLALPRRLIHMIISTGALYVIFLFALMITAAIHYEYVLSLTGPISITTIIAISINLLVLYTGLPEPEEGEAGPSEAMPTFPTDPIIDLALLG